MTTVYLDLDGVLADFDTMARRILGGDDWKQEIEKPNWGRLSLTQDLYAILEPFPDAKELVEYVSIYGNVEILTAIPRRAHFPDAVDHKRAWVDRHFPGLKTNFGPYAKDKQFHYKDGDILIDDSHMNIEQWKARGGRAYLHTSVTNTKMMMERDRMRKAKEWVEKSNFKSVIESIT